MHGRAGGPAPQIQPCVLAARFSRPEFPSGKGAGGRTRPANRMPWRRGDKPAFSPLDGVTVRTGRTISNAIPPTCARENDAGQARAGNLARRMLVRKSSQMGRGPATARGFARWGERRARATQGARASLPRLCALVHFPMGGLRNGRQNGLNPCPVLPRVRLTWSPPPQPGALDRQRVEPFHDRRPCRCVSAAASRRFRISFSAFRVSMAASSTRTSAKSSGMARDDNADMAGAQRLADPPRRPTPRAGLARRGPLAGFRAQALFQARRPPRRSCRAAGPPPLTRRDVRAPGRRPTADRRRWR